MAANIPRTDESPSPTTSAGDRSTSESAGAVSSPARAARSTNPTNESKARIYTGNLTHNPIICGVDNDDWSLDDYRRDLAGLKVPGWEPDTKAQRGNRIKAAVEKMEDRAKKEVSKIMRLQFYTPEYHPGMNMANLTKRPRHVPMIALGERSADDMVYGFGWASKMQAKETGAQIPTANESFARESMAEMKIVPDRSRTVARRSRQQVDTADFGEHNLAEGRRNRKKVDKESFYSSPPLRSSNSRSPESVSSNGTIDEIPIPALATPKPKSPHKAAKTPAKGTFSTTPKAAPRSYKKRPDAATDADGAEATEDLFMMSGALPAGSTSKKARSDGQSALTTPMYRLAPKEETEEEEQNRRANVATIEAKRAAFETLQAAKRAVRDV